MQAVDVQMSAMQERTAKLDHCDNELRAQKKGLSEMKGKKRQLEQKISTKQDRWVAHTHTGRVRIPILMWGG